MKKSTKYILIIAGVGLAAGLLMLFFGMVMGASRYIYLDSTGVHIYEEGNEETVTVDDLSFDKVYINAMTANVEIIPSDKARLEIVQKNNDGNISYTCENGELRVVENFKSRFRFFNLDFRFMFDKSSNIITLYLPPDKLDDVSLNITSGIIKASGITTCNLDIDIISGSINLEDITADTAEFNLTSGRLTADNVKATDSRLSVMSGSCNFTDTYFGGLRARITSGSTRYEGTLAGIVDIESMSGSATFDLTGSADDFNKNFSSLSGSIKLNGQQRRNYDENISAPNSLKVSVTSGSVRFDFED